MSNIEKKAKTLVNKVRSTWGRSNTSIDRQKCAKDEALCRSLEKHKATKQKLRAAEQELRDLRQEVSNEAKDYKHNGKPEMWFGFDRFIIPASKPDPLVELFLESFADSNIGKNGGYWNIERKFRAGMETRGLQIVKVKEQ